MSQNKVALVTGSANGIGKACALNLARSGLDLILVDVEEDRLQTLYENISSEGFSATTISGDCRDTNVLDEVFNQAEQEFDGVDILINNAGINKVSPINEVDDKYIDEIYKVNLRGPIIMTKEISKIMIKKRRGKIINIS